MADNGKNATNGKNVDSARATNGRRPQDGKVRVAIVGVARGGGELPDVG